MLLLNEPTVEIEVDFKIIFVKKSVSSLLSTAGWKKEMLE